jgi:hypothetical protein
MSEATSSVEAGRRHRLPAHAPAGARRRDADRLSGNHPVIAPNPAVQQISYEQGSNDPQPVADEHLWPALLWKRARMGSDHRL